MNQQTVLELCTFKLVAGTDRHQFSQANKAVDDFLREQDGFQYRSLSYCESEDLWIDTVYWQDMHAATKAANNFWADQRSQPFMQMLDKESVHMRHAAIERNLDAATVVAG